MSNLKKVVLLWVAVILVVLNTNHLGPFKYKAPLEEPKVSAVGLNTDLGKVVAEVEAKNYNYTKVKEQLVEQGYPEEAVDDLLSQGAQRAVPLQNIASVLEVYGNPWNLTLNVGGYELVGLYLVGNDTSRRFVLGQYQDESEENVVFLHMSSTESVTTLQAGLVYKSEVQLENCTLYLTEDEKIVGFKFEVESGESVMTYVATGSSIFTQEVVDSFIGSIVDGKLR